MFRFLESFNNRQNRLGLKYSRLNSFRVGHFQTTRTSLPLVDSNTKLDTLTGYRKTNTQSATE